MRKPQTTRGLVRLLCVILNLAPCRMKDRSRRLSWRPSNTAIVVRSCPSELLKFSIVDPTKRSLRLSVLIITSVKRGTADKQSGRHRLFRDYHSSQLVINSSPWLRGFQVPRCAPQWVDGLALPTFWTEKNNGGLA